jgi:hypothetical protein
MNRNKDYEDDKGTRTSYLKVMMTAEDKENLSKLAISGSMGNYVVQLIRREVKKGFNNE